jgi:hypothetical protein
MKILLSALALALSFHGLSQTTICGTANEGGSVTLTAPAGNAFTSVTFTSYGTPNGNCGSFTVGACHAANSQTIVEAALIGKASATIAATNGVFGDPCGGTVKRLYIEAVYSSTLPLHLASFSGISNGHSNILQWQTTNEVNTQSFDVERSTDGRHFSVIGSIASANNSGTNLYSYTDNSISHPVYFYRLKMTDQDGNFTYSKIIKTEKGSTGKLEIFPNPVTNNLSISGLNAMGNLEIMTLHGASLKRLSITGNTQTINLANYPAGMYILKYTTGRNTVYQKLVKQ